VSLPQGSLIVLVIKDQEIMVPTYDTVLEAEDRVIAVTRADTEQDLRAELSGS